jgi:toxin secretion/phage lysis holin
MKSGVTKVQNKELQMFISAAFAGLLYYLGIVSIPIVMLIFAMIVDYTTGMMAAWTNSELSSKRGIKGIVKKVGYLALVVAAMIIDWLISQGLQQINVDITYSVFFAVLVAVWLIINELISTLENLSRMGVPIPNFLKKIINKLKMTVDKGDGENDG